MFVSRGQCCSQPWLEKSYFAMIHGECRLMALLGAENK